MSEVKQNPVMPDFENMDEEAVKTMYIDGLHGEALAEDNLRTLETRVTNLEARLTPPSNNESRMARVRKSRVAKWAGALVVAGGLLTGFSHLNTNLGDKADPTPSALTEAGDAVEQAGKSLQTQVARVSLFAETGHQASGSTVSSDVPERFKAVKGAKTVVTAMEKYQSTNPEQAANDILLHRGSFNNLNVSHDENKVSELAGKYEKISTLDAYEAYFMSIVNDEQNSQANLNVLNGKRAATATELSHAERVKELARLYTADGTKFERVTVTGSYWNAHVKEQGEQIGDKLQNFEKVDALKITLEDGRTILNKIGGGSDAEGEVCLNPLLKKAEAPAPRPASPEKPASNEVTPDNPEPESEVKPKPQPVAQKAPAPEPKDEPKPTPPPRTVPPKVVPPPVVTPPVTPPPEAGKDHRESPVSGDRNDPDQDRRPNIPAPAVAIQPVDAPAVDPYVPPVPGPQRPDVIAPADDPRPVGEREGSDTPAASPNTDEEPNTGTVEGV